MARSRIPWTEGMRARLLALWYDPTVSLRSIGKAIGVSDDVASNEASRLHLPARSTIREPDAHKFKPSGHAPIVRPLRYGARTLPLLPSEEAAQKGEGAE